MDSPASNKGSAQHGSFFLSRSRASLFYLCLSAQTLRELAIFETATLYQIRLELDNALKSCEAYTHRYKHTPCEHEIHVSAGSAGRQMLRRLRIKFWGREKDGSGQLNSKQPQMGEPQHPENLRYGEGAKKKGILEERRRQQYGSFRGIRKMVAEINICFR